MSSVAQFSYLNPFKSLKHSQHFVYQSLADQKVVYLIIVYEQDKTVKVKKWHKNKNKLNNVTSNIFVFEAY